MGIQQALRRDERLPRPPGKAGRGAEHGSCAGQPGDDAGAAGGGDGGVEAGDLHAGVGGGRGGAGGRVSGLGGCARWWREGEGGEICGRDETGGGGL